MPAPPPESSSRWSSNGEPSQVRLASSLWRSWTWNELLAGEGKLAYRTEVPPRRRTSFQSRRSSTRASRFPRKPRAERALPAPGGGLRRSQPRRALVVSTGRPAARRWLQPPVLDALAEEPKLRALYLYPTKALAQERRGLLVELEPAPAAGDLRRRHAERGAGRSAVGNVILTNPDMLHVGILPHHTAWGDVLRTSATSSWTRPTSTAGSSVPRRQRPAGCAARAIYRAEPSSCSLPPRWPTRASSSSRSSASTRP